MNTDRPPQVHSMLGIVRAFDEGVGLGTIVGDGGREYEFHCVEIADGSRWIDVGAAVEFTTLDKLGRVEAAAVRPRQ